MSLAQLWNTSFVRYGYILLGLAVFLGVFGSYLGGIRRQKAYAAIPAIGRTGIFSSYIEALRVFRDGRDMIQEGYDKYYPGCFRIPSPTGWFVFATGDELVDEVARAPDNILSAKQSNRNSLAADYTLGPTIYTNDYHVGILRGQLTRSLGELFVEIHDEITAAFSDEFKFLEEWQSFCIMQRALVVVSRVSGRTFVGLPLCRNPEYIRLNIDHTLFVAITGYFYELAPMIVKPVIGSLASFFSNYHATAKRLLKPLIEERRNQKNKETSDHPRPSTILSWFMDVAKGPEQSVDSLVQRILALNFASAHTTSMTFTHALLELAIRPEYLGAIRNEAEIAIATHGWTKEAIDAMRKLDSFIKEDQRLTGIAAVGNPRKAMKDVTLSDGTRIPKGTTVFAPLRARHTDDEIYPNAREFRGFRFSDEAEEFGTQTEAVNPSRDFLIFGLGHHACPGRFFAMMVIKTMIAHILINYEFRVVNAPKHRWFGLLFLTDRKAELLFRKRKTRSI